MKTMLSLLLSRPHSWVDTEGIGSTSLFPSGKFTVRIQHPVGKEPFSSGSGRSGLRGSELFHC